MSLNWNFKEDFIGTMKSTFGENTWVYNLYDGNALCIMLTETESTYALSSFFADKAHMNNCLGLTKGYENMWEDYEIELTLLKSSKSAKTVADGFSKAKFQKDITIKLTDKVSKYYHK